MKLQMSEGSLNRSFDAVVALDLNCLDSTTNTWYSTSELLPWTEARMADWASGHQATAPAALVNVIKTLGSTPAPRLGATLISVSDRWLLLFGGSTSDNGSDAFNDLWCYDIGQ